MYAAGTQDFFCYQRKMFTKAFTKASTSTSWQFLNTLLQSTSPLSNLVEVKKLSQKWTIFYSGLPVWQSKVKILFCISPALKRQDLYRGAFLQVLSKELLLIRDLGWQFWIRATRGSNIFCNGKCIPVLSTATFSLDFHQHQQNHDFVFSTSHSIANFGFWSFTLKISETLNNNIQGWLIFFATTN